MKTKRHFYLMISCPGDVINERKLLKDCVEIINSERTDDAWVELQYWATDTSSDAGMLAQDSINEQIVKDSDGLIAIFNARLGTPVHSYKCGTDEEIALMLEAKKHVSLLFNTKPQIDLSNPTSIEQITKLQEYKKEQSQKAYYREFSDEESFMTLARREILLWLRNITNSPTMHCPENKEPTAITNSQPNNDSVLDHQEIVKNEPDGNMVNLPPQTSEIDTEAGVLDCVIYITDAAQELTNEINSFTHLSSELTAKTNNYNDKIQLYKKQKNGNAGILLLCKQFSKDIDANSEESHIILEKIETKWNEIYQYLKIYNDNSLNHQDKIIVKDSVNALREIFVQSLPKMENLTGTLTSMPNFQKDLKIAVDGLSNVYKRFKSFTVKAISNCEEIESLLMIDYIVEV